MNELDDLLKSLRAERPRPMEIARWKSAVIRIHGHKAGRWVELIAAMMVGVLIGSTVFNKPSDEQKLSDDATYERVVTKIE